MLNGRVKAEVHSDDYVFEVDFDCTAWFEQAREEDILNLCECGWRGDYPADEVAQYCSNFNFDVRCALEYASRKKDMGFEVSVCEESAKLWLRTNKPILFKRITHYECQY